MKNKKSLSIFLSCIVCFFLGGCFIDKSPRFTLIGAERPMMGANSVTVTSAELIEDTITIKLNLKFEDVALADFEKIYIHKSEHGSPYISCDIEKSQEMNNMDYFSAPYIGEVALVFTDPSIDESDELSHYDFTLSYLYDNGIMNSYRFCLRHPDDT